MARYMRSDLGRGHTNLAPPRVVLPDQVPGDGKRALRTTLVAVYRSGRLHPARKTVYRLEPPAVVTPAAVFTAPPTRVHIAPSSALARRAHSHLSPPAVVGAGIAWHGPGVYLTRPSSRPGKAVLHPPAVVTAAVTAVFYGPVTHVTRGRRGAPHSFLRASTDTIGLEDQGRISTQFAPQRRGVPKSRLAPPTVVAPVVSYGPAQWLAYSRRGTAKSHLFPPAVVASAVVQVFYGPKVTLTRIRPPRVYPDLGQPIHFQTQALGWIGISLAPSRRPVAKSRLPQVVPTAVVVQAFYGPQITLAPSRRPRPKSALRPPAILASNLPTAVTLAPQRRGAPTSVLRSPVVVFLAVEIYGPEVSLTRITHPPVQSLLSPPAVVQPRQEFFGPELHLTYSLRGKPKSVLHPPTDTVGLEDQGLLDVHLAPQRRGAPKSRLEPPVVVFLAVEIYGPEQWLAYSRRPITKSRLEPPTVVAPVVSYGPFQWLTYSRRGRPVYFLRKPQAVAQPPAYQQVLPPWLTYSRRGRPKSILRKPTRVFPFFARPTQVFLAPPSRGAPESFLQPPAVIRIPKADRLSINLTYSRRGAPHSFLQPPRVVRLAVEIYGPEAWLTYSRRGAPKSALTPGLAGRPPFRGIKTWLTRIKPRPTVSLIKPPTVVRVTKTDVLRVNLTYSRRGRPISFQTPFTPGKAPFRPLQVHLTRIRPPRTGYRLYPASVIGAGIAFYGPLTTFARIKHPPVQHFLRLTLVAFRRPHGDVCGFDIAGSFVCSLELSGSQVSGSEGVRFQITGSSRATTKITGSESTGGSVSGSDRKAT